MSHKTIKTLNRVADTLEATVKGFVSIVVLVGRILGALFFGKPKDLTRKARRTYTRRSPSFVRHSVYRQAPPTLTIKIVQEKEQ
jgi:hypothetical protein